MSRRRRLQIPKVTQDVPPVIRRVLDPLRTLVTDALVTERAASRAVTRADLVKLGLATEADLQQLDEEN